MKLESINVGRPEAIDPANRDKRTGIFKRRIEGSVPVSRLGIAKDAVVDTRNHGGPDQALYLYTLEDYHWWAEQDVATGPGQFGENLTVSGIESSRLCIGDRLVCGGVTMEVTAPRIPCSTFAAKMGDSTFVKRFRDAGRPGAYLRVIAEGRIQAGQVIELVPYPGDRLTLGVHYALCFSAAKTPPEPDMVARLLALPLAERARADVLKWKAARDASPGQGTAT